MAGSVVKERWRRRDMLCLLVCWLYVGLLSSASAKTPLTDRILHYEPLDYSTTGVRDQHSRVVRSASTRVRLSFEAMGRQFNLVLWPASGVLAPGSRFLVQQKDGSLAPASYDHRTFYQGRQEGDPSSRVHGHLVHGVFDGVIALSNHRTYHIEHAHKFFNHSTDFHSVIYSDSDVVFVHPNQTGSSCAIKQDYLAKMKELLRSAKPAPQTTHKHSKENTLSGMLKRTKRASTIDGRQFCQIRIVADERFLGIFNGDVQAAMSEILVMFTSVQQIYRGTDFDSSGGPDNVTPQLVDPTILTQANPSLYGGNSITVNSLLDLWSQQDHSRFCLALLLTYRDFANGVLGLAWVAQPAGGQVGGICQGRVGLSVGDRWLNTAVVTLLNFGQRQPRSVSIITITHEFGHNFGSPHDPENFDVECTPGGSSGNYIMYPRATDGSQTNNRMFSPCSRRSVLAVLRTKSDCFEASPSICGNGLREEGEECDCGNTENDALCRAVDPCCSTNCTLRQGALCSAVDSCCSDQCVFESSSIVCSPRTECSNVAFCNGTADCPAAVAVNASCNAGLSFCLAGECTGSVCLSQNLMECQCTNERELCHVCCSYNGECQSIFTLAEMGVFRQNQTQNRATGRSCNDFHGYCDDQSNCIEVNNEDILNDLTNIFSTETLNAIIAWLTEFWWVPIVVLVVIIIIIVLLHLTYRKRKPLKKGIRRMSVRRGSQQAAAAASAVAGGQRRGGGSRQQRREESIQRLKKFFPGCNAEIITDVLRSTDEQKAVKKLLQQGFPLKKIPLPT